MLNKIKLVILCVAICGLTACFTQSSERMKAAGEQAQGNVQETVGNVTNNDELKSKGQTNRIKGKLRDAKEDVKDVFKN